MKRQLKLLWAHKAHVVMAMPAFLVFLIFSYIPMTGLVMAFKDFDFKMGVWNSPWNGLDNFKFLLVSKSTFAQITFNTIAYYVIFTVIGMFLEIVLAIAMDQLVFKKFGKVMQCVLIIPIFISFTAVQFIVYAFLSSDTGMINHLFGVSTRWYMEAKYWPIILTIVKIWNGTGYGSVLYMSVLAGIDPQLYEAADIDGANKWQQIKHVTLPSLIPMITVMLLLSVGSIMHSDTGLFYQVTRNSGTLYSTTQVIDSYILNSIFHNSNFGFTAAATFFQSIVGTVLILASNAAVKKVSPDNALF